MKRIALFLAVVVAAIACNNEEAIVPEVTVKTAEADLVLPQAGDEIWVEFTSNVDWTAALKEAEAADYWAITPKSGLAGDGKVRVTVYENDTNENRTATLVITAETAVKEIVLTQLQKNALVAGSTALTVGAEGGEVEVKVAHNVDFQVAVDADWLVETKAMKETELVFTAAGHKNLEPRTATITITAGDLTQTVTVTQEAFVPVFAPEVLEEIWFPCEGGTATLEFTANFDCEVVSKKDYLTAETVKDGDKYTVTLTMEANPSFAYDAVELVITGYTVADDEATEEDESVKYYVFQHGRASETWVKYTTTDYSWTLIGDKARFALVGNYILAANGGNVIKVLSAADGSFLQDYTLPEGMNINMLTTDDAGNIIAMSEVPYGGSADVYYMTSLEGEPVKLGTIANDVYSNFAGNLRVAGDVTTNAALVMYCNLAQYYFGFNVVDGVLDETRTTAALPESEKTVWNCGHCVVYPLGDNLSKGLVYTGYINDPYNIYQTSDLETWNVAVAGGYFNGNDNPNSMDIATIDGKTYLAVGVGTHFSYTQARVVLFDVTDWAAVKAVGTWNLPNSSSSWKGVAGAWSDVAIAPTSDDSLLDIYYFGANNEVIAKINIK